MSADGQLLAERGQKGHAIAAPGRPLVDPRPRPRRRGERPQPAAAQVEAARRAVHWRERRQRTALVLADAVATAAALLVCAPLFHAGPVTWALAPPLVLLLAKAHGLYERDELLIRKTTLDQAPSLLHVATLTAVALWLAGQSGTTRQGFVALVVAIVTGTLVARCAARLLVRLAVPPERCIFIGDAAQHERLRGKLASRAVHAELAGRLALRDDGDPSAPADDLIALQDLIAATGAHRVVIDPQALGSGDTVDVVRAAKALGLRVSVIPRALDVVGTAVVFDELEGMTVLGVRRFGLGRWAEAGKRGFDVVFALLALLLVAPLMAAVALAIVLDSRGPVLFRQERIGRDGRPFRILKFRTMQVHADARRDDLRDRHGLHGDLFKLAADPRVTRVGGPLRRSSLDELPQLLNVLRGEMSLVGPRPLVADEDAQITGWDRRRLHLKPGMTGNWQIAGSGRVPLAEMVKIDYLYVAGWSLWLDVKILLRTVPHVLLRRGM